MSRRFDPRETPHRHGNPAHDAAIEEYLAGRIDRRSFLRHAALLGLLTPLAGAMASRPARAAGTDRAARALTVGMPVPAGLIDPLTVGDTVVFAC